MNPHDVLKQAIGSERFSKASESWVDPISEISDDLPLDNHRLFLVHGGRGLFDFPVHSTIRMALWTGEEQGLLGSAGYTKNHFADRETMELKAEHRRLAGYFNLDNGGGKIRGIYCQNNAAVRPIFQAWLEPFHDLSAATVTIRNTGGTDHLSFDRIGLPGFQFIQEPLDYSSRTHHTNMDTYERIIPGDVMQASVILASFVYHAAMRDEMLPRKPLPKPRPREREESKELMTF